MKKTILFLMLNVFLLAAIAAPIKTITFATEATYPPFEYITPSGDIQGFDIDLAKALCLQAKISCTFINRPFDSLITGLKLEKFDAVIAAIAITDARKSEVDFTESYYADNVSFIAQEKSSFNINPEKIKGKTIGVQAGTTFEQYLQKTYGNTIKINTYASEESAFLDLNAERIDAVMGDTPLVKKWLQEHSSKQYAIIELPKSDQTFFGKGDGIAVKKGNTELLMMLNKALAQIKMNGTYKKIKESYFK